MFGAMQFNTGQDFSLEQSEYACSYIPIPTITRKVKMPSAITRLTGHFPCILDLVICKHRIEYGPMYINYARCPY